MAGSQVIYVAHPYGGQRKNLRRALDWIEWCCKWAELRNRDVGSHEHVLILAPWIAYVETLSESPDMRSFGLNAARQLFRALAPGMRTRSDVSVCIFGELSTGCKAEAWAVDDVGGLSYNCTALGEHPPTAYFDPRRHPSTTTILCAPSEWGEVYR